MPGQFRKLWGRLRTTVTAAPGRARHADRRDSDAATPPPARAVDRSNRTGRDGQWRSAPDFRGVPDLEYAPVIDDRPDPGEVIWAWVPFEEDQTRGKDRPALVVGHDTYDDVSWVLALPLTSKDHDRDAAQEARAGRFWLDIGTGSWDSKNRPSEVRVDRIVRIDPGSVRRDGGQVDEATFTRVAEAVRRHR